MGLTLSIASFDKQLVIFLFLVIKLKFRYLAVGRKPKWESNEVLISFNFLMNFKKG